MVRGEVEHEISSAKAHLLKDGTYDKLVGAIKQLLNKETDCLQHALVRDEITSLPKPSSKLKQIKTPSVATQKAKNCDKIFKPHELGQVADFSLRSNPIAAAVCPAVLDNQRYFSQCGVGLSETESVSVYLSIKKFLENERNIGFCRFWGKIIGLQKNYYVIETTEIQINPPEFVDANGNNTNDRTGSAKSLPESRDSLPLSNWKPPVTIQPEFKAGPNRFVYYVCNECNGNWTKLPDVTPEEIITSRKIIKYMTGNLEANLDSFPNFPGKEKNYLRAQIARISASTIIAPNGRMSLAADEEEEEEDDETGSGNAGDLVLSSNFEIIPPIQLLDFDNWVHIRQALSQKQARTQYWKPPKEPKNFNYDGGDDEEEEEEEEEEEDEETMEELEEPIPILREISMDGKTDEDEDNNDEGTFTGKELWTKRVSSRIIHHAVVCLKSTIWPGAVTFARHEKFESIYIGNGLKYNIDNFSPEKIPDFEKEADLKHEQKDCAEMTDPTVEEETQLRERQAMNDEDEGEESDEGEDDGEGEEEEED